MQQGRLKKKELEEHLEKTSKLVKNKSSKTSESGSLPEKSLGLVGAQKWQTNSLHLLLIVKKWQFPVLVHFLKRNSSGSLFQIDELVEEFMNQIEVAK